MGMLFRAAVEIGSGPSTAIDVQIENTDGLKGDL